MESNLHRAGFLEKPEPNENENEKKGTEKDTFFPREVCDDQKLVVEPGTDQHGDIQRDAVFKDTQATSLAHPVPTTPRQGHNATIDVNDYDNEIAVYSESDPGSLTTDSEADDDDHRLPLDLPVNRPNDIFQQTYQSQATNPLLNPQAPEPLTLDHILSVFPTHQLWLINHSHAMTKSAETRAAIASQCTYLLALKGSKTSDMRIRSRLCAASNNARAMEDGDGRIVVNERFAANHHEWEIFFDQAETKVRWAKRYMGWMQLLEDEYERIMPAWEATFATVAAQADKLEVTATAARLTICVREIALHSFKRVFLQKKIWEGSERLGWLYEKGPEWIHWRSQ